MIAILVWAVLGAAVAASARALTSNMFDVAALQRRNYRQAPIVTGVGVLVPISMVLVAAVALVWEQATPTLSAWDLLLWPALVAAVGFSLLGLLDDVAGHGQSGGFRGHLDELRHGELTSGVVKMVGGAALGVVVAARMGTVASSWGAVELVRNGAIVALSANLANLLDRAPGRTIKVAATAFVVTALVSRSAILSVPAGGIGAGVGLLRADLTERSMLGDAGSNALGALCGLAALVAAPGAAGRWAVLAVLLAANLASEAVSFTKVIDSVPPLRWFDRLGSRRPS